MSDWIENITDKDFLQDNLTFTSLYIAIYEHLVDYVVSNVKDFLCDLKIQNGELVYKESCKYKEEIRNRVVDEKGNKDIRKASFLWLVDNGAITLTEYEKILEIKQVRNKYAHELTSIIFEGVIGSEVSLLFDMYFLYCKISRWFYVEIEAPIAGIDLKDVSDINSIQSAASYAFGIIFDVLYNGKSKEYKEMVASIKEGKQL